MGSAKAKGGPIRIGINPIGWSNDDLPELGGDIPLERCLKETRQAGYSGIEKGGKFPSDAKDLKPIMAQHGLQLVSGWFSGLLLDLTVEQEKTRIAPHLRLLQEMGSPVMIYAETTSTVQDKLKVAVADRRGLSTDALRRYGEKLTSFAEWLATEQCPMAYHHHMGTVVESEAEIDTLMAGTDKAVGLLFDTGHLTFAGGDVAATLRRHHSRIVHVHAKNIREPVMAKVRSERLSFLEGVIQGVFTVPGDPEGCVDFRETVKILAESGYKGWIVVEAEQDPKKAEPLRYASMGHDEIAAACAAAGMSVVR